MKYYIKDGYSLDEVNEHLRLSMTKEGLSPEANETLLAMVEVAPDNFEYVYPKALIPSYPDLEIELFSRLNEQTKIAMMFYNHMKFDKYISERSDNEICYLRWLFMQLNS